MKHGTEESVPEPKQHAIFTQEPAHAAHPGVLFDVERDAAQRGKLGVEGRDDDVCDEQPENPDPDVPRKGTEEEEPAGGVIHKRIAREDAEFVVRESINMVDQEVAFTRE
jgi:hypothetical protein